LIGKATEPVESRHSFSSDDSRDGKCHMNEEQRQMKFGVQKSKSALNIPMGMYYSCGYVVCTNVGFLQVLLPFLSIQRHIFNLFLYRLATNINNKITIMIIDYKLLCSSFSELDIFLNL
jgi:hypothetical protein